MNFLWHLVTKSTGALGWLNSPVSEWPVMRPICETNQKSKATLIEIQHATMLYRGGCSVRRPGAKESL